MNKRLKRFLEYTLPAKTLPGVTVIICTSLFGVTYALVMVLVFTIIDVVYS